MTTTTTFSTDSTRLFVGLAQTSRLYDTLVSSHVSE